MVMPFRLSRVFLYWLLLFVILYVISFFLFGMYMSTNNLLAAIGQQLAAPIVYFIFGWLYYRKANIEHWHWRLAVIPIWLLLSIGMSAILIKPIYGYDWTAAINLAVFEGQLLNVAALVVAAYVGSPSKGKGVEGSERLDGLEGPKF